MAYAVKTTTRSELDLEAIHVAIHADESETARKWYLGLSRAILSLEHNPQRCPGTPESKMLRHLLYGRKPHVYRVIFRIVEKRQEVEVLHIRHGARDRFSSEDLASQL
jgi:plasmid stabilization system protein ParE